MLFTRLLNSTLQRVSTASTTAVAPPFSYTYNLRVLSRSHTHARPLTLAASAMPGTLRRSSRSVPIVEPPPAPPKRQVSTSKITKAVSNGIADEIQQERDVNGEEPPPPPKKRGRKRATPPKTEDDAALKAQQQDSNTAADTQPDDPSTSEPAPKKKRAPRKKTAATAASKASPSSDGENHDPSVAVDDEPELDSDGEPVRRAKNGRRLPKKKPKAPKTYIIPDVEQRDFRQEFRPGSTDSFSSQSARASGFTGRLGYACLNTVLRSQDPPVFSSRTARIKSIEEKGLDWVKELARANAKDIIPMIQWNAENNIRFMRLSSEIFPFASHATYGYHPDCAAEELAEAGRVARSLNHRLTMHPGQFVQLGSPNPAVVEASIRELDVHATVLDLMGMDQDSVMIIHGGGVYGNRPATLERMKETIRTKLPQHVRNRLVLENDEISWSAEELLPVCHEFNIPMVFDFHHDMLRPSKKTPAEFMPELLELFRGRGIKPKFHLSHPRPGSRNLRERRAHSDRCGSLPLDLPPDADLMIEAKDKEQAVLELYRIYNLFPVQHSILRPPADDITSATSGRRKVLNGSGGAKNPASDEDDEAEPDGDKEGSTTAKKKPPTKRETEADKVLRSILHSKKIAQKRGVPYTGPEYYDAASASQKRIDEGSPILNTFDTMKVMEKEAEAIRNELKATRNTRAVSEIRAEVEGQVVGDMSVEGDHIIPKEEVVRDPNEYNVPGQEEKPPYQPVTPLKKAAAGQDGGGVATVVVPTSAENVDRQI